MVNSAAKTQNGIKEEGIREIVISIRRINSIFDLQDQCYLLLASNTFF
jgi:Ran GTPase-activating protein (RanGAP) involved in mRNA processing and transport